jgi:lipoate-protein ligase A
MLCLNLKSTDPCFNHAIEEILLKNSSEAYLILYINSSSVIIGKHQVAHREADSGFVAKRNIPVIRRISGGGAVYHDPGNLNFTFIIQSAHGSQVDFRKYTQPVIGFLDSIGVKACFEEKNDLRVNGMKISGNAEHVFHDRVMHHGTLLFDSDLDTLKASLRKDTSNYSTRAVGSNPSSVMNLKGILKKITDIEEFRMRMMEYFLAEPGNVIFDLTGELKAEAGSLADSKFRTWEWNYAYGPEYHFDRRFEVDGKLFSCHMFVKDGIIHLCDIEGSEELCAAGKKLIGCRHMPEEVLRIFGKERINDKFAGWIF